MQVMREEEQSDLLEDNLSAVKRNRLRRNKNRILDDQLKDDSSSGSILAPKKMKMMNKLGSLDASIDDLIDNISSVQSASNSEFLGSPPQSGGLFPRRDRAFVP